ncbi:molybdenum cofactor biosynthesis prote [Parathielavia appendiculata]|uniref:Molybdenum cofactor biosynthesis prote n=1 Tax=Parathielavia appendiculata TaxID=2587402 RepID=A0AAN6TZ74_9PEZI|nr:molybdenum cofactor biosynthesis prote [Parathielavia appendiculata]
MALPVRCVTRSLRAGALQIPRPHRTVKSQARRITSESPAVQTPEHVPPQRPLLLATQPGALIQDPNQDGSVPSRRDRIRDAKPYSDFLTDTFHRQHDYLRISVTERCNLRCLYCMPEEGVPLSPPKELLTTPEIVMLSSLFVSQGVTKVRLTGGEPTVRRDIVPLMQQIGALRAHGLRELCLTTNGLSLHRKLEPMVDAGLTGVNLSLDTLDPWQFQLMTRRAGFGAVQKTIDRIFELNRAGAGIKFKINCVVMRGLNDREILPFVELTREKKVEVRFIEYMPFDGNKWSEGKMFSYQEMLDRIRSRYPDLQRVKGHKNDTSKTFQVPGFVGKLGFITSMTNNFCGTCNRLRITSDGNLKVCLFGNAEVSLRDIIRKVNRGDPIDDAAFKALEQAALERIGRLPPSSSQSLVVPNSEELLNVIGMAVKRKKEKHAGLGELEHMKNRPMILIDSTTSSQRRLQSYPRRSQFGFSPTFRPPGRLLFPLPSVTAANQITAGELRLFSTTTRRHLPNDDDEKLKLTHVTASGAAHMVSISEKPPTKRIARAKCTVRFSSPTPLALIRDNQIKKGDVLGVARIAGIMAAKRTPELIPLCHPVALTHAEVTLVPRSSSSSNSSSSGDGEGKGEREQEEGGRDEIEITATVSCDGKTGVEMEALTAAGAAALTVFDMCKAVDTGMVIEGLRVVLKEGGKSGRWVEEEKVE